MIKKLTEKEIRETSAIQLCGRVSRLHFDKEAGSEFPGDAEEIEIIEKVLKERLIKMLGRDFYPLEVSTTACIKPIPMPAPKVVQPEAQTAGKIKFKVAIINSMGSTVTTLNLHVDGKGEADAAARETIKQLGLKKATYKIT